jgi:hypothetical protein
MKGRRSHAFSGLRGTAAARSCVYQRREPLSLMYWGMTAVIMVVLSANTILTPQYLVALLLSAGVGAAAISAFHADSIAMTGPSFFLEAIPRVNAIPSAYCARW